MIGLKCKKGYKILAYIMAFVLLLTAVPVAVSKASDYVIPQTFADQGANYLIEWQEKGNDGKTTLFIGDSTMSPQIWRNFYEFYEGKDVLRAGIGSSRTDDWKILANDFLAHTSPKNLVIHLGGNDIGGTSYSNGVKKSPQETYESVVSLFETLREVESLKDTKFYYFGIKTRADSAAAAKISETNTLIKAWCAENTWVKFADTSAVVADDLYDKVHINMESYQKMYDALAKTGIEIEDAKKNIDVYLIAGQSNAAGYSTYESTILSGLDERYIDGFDNIYYSGTVSQLGDDSRTREFSVQEVKAGLGIKDNRIGPEIGMADVLSSRYNNETGAYAGFIKYAVGGSSLLNDRSNTANETWTSPTYKKQLTTAVTDGTNTGVLYDNFLSEVEERLAEYKEAGFNPIIKGMYWMQGESDRKREAEYINAFEDFTADVRKDLSTISGQDLTDMPIMVGEISETFSGYNEATLNVNREFLATQRMLPSLVSECYLIENSGFAVTGYDPENPDSETGLILGTDSAHWNYQDCISIGKLVGDQILEWDEVATGDINADTKVDGTDLSKLRNMLVRNVEDASQLIAPDVYVNYDGGKVVNDGDESIKIGTYKLDKDKSSTAFVEKNDVSYTASRNGDVNGAIVSNHATGPYTVVRDYQFGKDDFTISTWFNLPEGATISGGGGGSYIMGIDHPDGKTGFSATLKDGSLRFKLLSTSSRQLRQIEGSALGFTVNRNQWYNLVISRENRVINVYFDGILLFTESIPEGYNFGTRDIGLGAYVGYGGSYQSADMYFDDLQVYRTALSASEVKAIAETDILIPERNDVNPDKKFDVKDLVDLKIAAANYTGTTPFDVDAADAVVNYNNSTVANSGTNSSITAGAYVLNAEKNSTSFDPATSVQYGAGVDGAENGAIITNNLNGAYTVLDKLNLGKDDFAVATWFNIPEGKLDGGNTNYLLGTTKAGDTTNGFRVTMRDTDDGVQLAYKAGANGQELYTLDNFDYGEWHHVAVSRIGNALFLYYDGELAKIQIIGDDFDFGDAKIAFGAQVGETWSYKDTNIMYDEVRFYQEEVTVAHVRDIFGMEEAPEEDGDDTGNEGGSDGGEVVEPTTAKVRVTFNGGTVANSGTDTSATAGAYVMDATTSGTKFVETNTVSYATGRDGSANGAIITEHKTGPYTVIKNCNFGTDDFTISTWFNTEKASAIGNNAGFYLFGTNKPDTGKGFSICIKKVSEEFRLRIRGAYKSTDESIVIPNIESNTWYNVTIARVGSVINLYFDGSLVGTYTVDTYDFENRELAFGGYYGLSDTYYGINTYFDDIYVFGEGLSANQIRELVMGKDAPKVRVTFDNGTFANTGTDTSIQLSKQVMTGTGNNTTFQATNTLNYTTGRDGKANGSIVTNHKTGPYAVVEDYSFGTNNFTISTWFNLEDIKTVGTNNESYLFGTNHSDTGNGLSACISQSATTGEYRIRIRAAYQSSQLFALDNVASGEWYNLTVARVGTVLNIYFNGSLLGTYTVNDFDFGTKDLAFGAYYGRDFYINDNIYFDDIEIYDVGLSADQVKQYYTTNVGEVNNGTNPPAGTETPPIGEEGSWE